MIIAPSTSWVVSLRLVRPEAQAEERETGDTPISITLSKEWTRRMTRKGHPISAGISANRLIIVDRLPTSEAPTFRSSSRSGGDNRLL
jgi:hypothetical protein